MSKNIFDTRVLTEDERKKLRITVDDGVIYKQSANDIKESLKDLVTDAAETINKDVKDKDMHVKPSVIMKLINTKYKNDMMEQKEKVAEIEDGLKLSEKPV